MNSNSRRSCQQGFTLTEMVVVVGTAAIVAGLLVFVLSHKNKPRPHVSSQQATAQRINCVNNLKQIGLAYRIWEGDNGDKFPMAVSTSKGGTMEFATGADTFRHFQVMSNELWTPKVLICPADTRIAASDYFHLENQNVSFFVGLDAKDSDPGMFLSGDRNITGPSKPKKGVLQFRSGDKARWTAEIHGNQGNIGLADGSVQTWSDTGLQKGLQNSGDSPHIWRLALPE